MRELLSAVCGGRRAGRHACKLDVSIARGLDYYTGIVSKRCSTTCPTIGSVCSGGRYDNLAELYTNQELPGIGASLGLDRLLAAMEELGMLDDSANAGPGVHPLLRRRPASTTTFELAARAPRRRPRRRGLSRAAKLGKQLQYADRKGFRVAVIAGEREFAAGECQVKDLATSKARQCRWPSRRIADPSVAEITATSWRNVNRIVYKASQLLAR